MNDVPFKQIPSNELIPLFYAEVDNSHANTSPNNVRALIIAPMLSSGVATPNVPRICSGASDAKTQCGLGSVGAQMAFAYRKNDLFGEFWLLPVADNGAGAAATGSISFTGPATAAGTLNLYVGGILVQVAVTSGMVATALATAVVAAVAANPNLSVTAIVDGTSAFKVNFTAKHLALTGNDIDIRLNYRGSSAGEATPAGIVATIVAMSGGTTAPVLTTALANLSDLPFEVIISPFTDSTSVAAMTAFLNDVSGRWSWSVQQYGHCVVAYRGTYSALTTWGLTNNDQHLSALAFYDSPTPSWKIAAAFGAQAAISVRADPAQPIREVVLQDVLAPPLASRFSLGQRNSLVLDGLSTWKVDQSGNVVLEKMVTTYQLDSFNTPDNSYRDAETMFNLAYCLRQLHGVVSSVLGRTKLAADSARLPAGAGVTTPAAIRALIIAAYQTLCDTGNAQQADVFAKGLVVQINANNPNRVDVLWPAILIERLDTFAVLAQFRLS